MGCVSGKERSPREQSISPKQDKVPSTRSSGRRSNASAKVETVEIPNGVADKDKERVKVKAKQNGTVTTATGVEDAAERRRERERERHAQVEPNPRLSNPPKNIEGEQVAAGWPQWLSQVAGEAIKGWIPRRADSFEKLDKIGQGTYSNVYKARDLDTQKIVALKKVRFDNLEPESVRFMAREIQVLRRLDHPNVVKLEGLVTSRMSCSLYLVFEYMEHDLAGLAACPGISFTEAQVKCYLQQLLRGLDHCHTRGVLHRDIKGSNLLLDNEGSLKIADFGLATFYHPDQKVPLTSRVVTLWYRPPELLLGATEYGVAVDLWSTGCILAELLAGKPIMPGRTEVEQLHKIFKLCGSPSEEYWRKSKLPHATIFKPQQPYKRCIADSYKDFPQSSLALLDTLLAIEPADRGTAAGALKSEFFTTKPCACDPSSLPKYPPSKEFDAKIRDEENRRQRAAGGRGRGDASRRTARDRAGVKGAVAPDANADFPHTMQKRRNQPSSKSKSEKFPPVHEDASGAFGADPSRGHGGEGRGTSPAPPVRPYLQTASTRSGPQPLVNPSTGTAWNKKQKEEDPRLAPTRPTSRPTKSMTVSDFSSQATYGQQPAAELSGISSLVAARNGAAGDHPRERGSSRQRDKDGEAVRRSDTYGSSRREHADAGGRHRSDVKREHLDGQRADAPYKRESIQESYKNVDGLQDSRRDSRGVPKEPSTMYQSKEERMYHSGPLLRQGYTTAVDIEELIEDHERQLQLAARRAAQAETGQTVRNSDKKNYDHKNWHHGRNGANENPEIVETGNGVGSNVSHGTLMKRNKSRTTAAERFGESEKDGIPSIAEGYVSKGQDT
eukprot:TRINITY_DN89_c0_g1_i1.p1 TRINITY_DN89_c0_g1~~TRINITY_DN89_c0_g1_i1.p1  ORF type:complete len:841 (-),score=180.01 TRINITY_DN89_c0_g1_i1:419-2941(-)